MIRQLDKNKQMDELMKQNEMLMNALQNANQLLEQMAKGSGQSDPSQLQQQLLQQLNQQNQQQNQQQDQQSIQQGLQQDLQQVQQQVQQQTGQQPNQAGQQNNNSQQQAANTPEPKQLANDLLQIKDLIAKLEIKTAAYVSNQTNNSLTEKDVVGLILNVIDGMLDWTAEFVANKGQNNSAG